jgi:hypothetical protein
VLVGVTGFEVVTPSSRTRCATRLPYIGISPGGGGCLSAFLPERVQPEVFMCVIRLIAGASNNLRPPFA